MITKFRLVAGIFRQNTCRYLIYIDIFPSDHYGLFSRIGYVKSFFFNKTSIITQQTFALMKKFWIHLEDNFRLCVLACSLRLIYLPQSYVFRKRLQDVLINMNTFILVISLQDVFKTSCKNICMNIFILMICLFKKSSKHFAKTSRYLEDVLKTFWRRFQNALQRCLQDIFKTSSGHIIKLNCSC